MPIILHLNIECLSARKICIVSQLSTRYKALVILLQEMHCTSADLLLIPHFILASLVSSTKHALDTFVHEKLSWALTDQYPEESANEWMCVNLDGCKIVNVYKPPISRQIPKAIPIFPYAYFYAGDFNCQHTDWGYDSISPNGKCLAD